MKDDFAEGLALMEQEQWEAARKCFDTELASGALSPLNRAKALANKLTCLDKEGKVTEAVQVAQEALAVIEEYDLWSQSWDGPKLRGHVKGILARLTGRPSPIWSATASMYAAFLMGASIGATIGAATPIQSVNVNGPVQTDLRYGLSALGGVIGFFVFTRFTVSAGALLSFVIVAFCVLYLRHELYLADPKLGKATLALLLAPPVLFLMPRLMSRR